MEGWGVFQAFLKIWLGGNGTVNTDDKRPFGAAVELVKTLHELVGVPAVEKLQVDGFAIWGGEPEVGEYKQGLWTFEERAFLQKVPSAVFGGKGFAEKPDFLWYV